MRKKKNNSRFIGGLPYEKDPPLISKHQWRGIADRFDARLESDGQCRIGDSRKNSSIFVDP